jgi:hypothetical protein
MPNKTDRLAAMRRARQRFVVAVFEQMHAVGYPYTGPNGLLEAFVDDDRETQRFDLFLDLDFYFDHGLPFHGRSAIAVFIVTQVFDAVHLTLL